MRRSCTALVLSVFLSAPFVALHAQQAGGHKGLHGALGFGSGSASLTCDGCTSDSENGTGVMIRLGGAVRPGVVLSAEINGWYKSTGGATGTLSWLNLVAQFYPKPDAGLYLKLGGGLAAMSLELGSVKVTATSPGAIGGVGYDVHLGKSFSLTPYVDYLYGMKGDAKVGGASTGFKLGSTLLHFGVAASFR